MSALRRLAPVLAVLACAGCYASVDGRHLFGPDVSDVVVRIAYARGVPPVHTGSRLDVVAANFARLFQGTGKTVTFPLALSEMTELDLEDRDYTLDEAVDIADSLGHDFPDRTQVITVVYLPRGIRDTAWLFGETRSARGVVAIAAGVLATTYADGGMDAAVLLHELGHAVGLVDSGLPMASPHLAEGGHCSNPTCVMAPVYGYAPSTISAAAPGATPVVFGDECLADAAAAARR